MGVSLSHYSKALLLLESSWHDGWLWWWTQNPLTAFALCVQEDFCSLLLLLCSVGLEKVPEVLVTIQDPIAFCCLLSFLGVVHPSDLHLSVEEAAWVAVAAALTSIIIKEPMSRSSHELICAVSELGFRV